MGYFAHQSEIVDHEDRAQPCLSHYVVLKTVLRLLNMFGEFVTLRGMTLQRNVLCLVVMLFSIGTSLGRESIKMFIKPHETIEVRIGEQKQFISAGNLLNLKKIISTQNKGFECEVLFEKGFSKDESSFTLLVALLVEMIEAEGGKVSKVAILSNGFTQDIYKIPDNWQRTNNEPSPQPIAPVTEGR